MGADDSWPPAWRGRGSKATHSLLAETPCHQLAVPIAIAIIHARLQTATGHARPPTSLTWLEGSFHTRRLGRQTRQRLPHICQKLPPNRTRESHSEHDVSWQSCSLCVSTRRLRRPAECPTLRIRPIHPPLIPRGRAYTGRPSIASGTPTRPRVRVGCGRELHWPSSRASSR